MTASAIRSSHAATSGLTPSRAAASRAARATSCNARRSASLHVIAAPSLSRAGQGGGGARASMLPRPADARSIQITGSGDSIRASDRTTRTGGRVVSAPGERVAAVNIRRGTGWCACFLSALILSGCGSDGDTAATGVSPARTTTVNIPELVATGEAVAWATLSSDEKTAVVERYLVVAGGSVDVEDLVAAADTAVGAASTSGSMRDYLRVLAAAISIDEPAGVDGAAVEEDADGTYTYRCDYVLGDFTDNTSTGYRLIASARLKNTGNIGTISRVTAIWDRLGTDPLKKTKTVRLASGKSVTVNFTIPIDQATLDLVQAADGDCRVRSAIADTFGSTSP